MSAEMELGADRYGAIRLAQTLAAQPAEEMLAAAIGFVEFLEQGEPLSQIGSQGRGLVQQARKIDRHCSTLVEGGSLVLDELLSRHGQRIAEEATNPDLVARLLGLPRAEMSLSLLPRASRYRDNPTRMGHIGLRAIGLAVTTLESVHAAAGKSNASPEALKDRLQTLSREALRIAPEARREPSRKKGYGSGSWY